MDQQISPKISVSDDAALRVKNFLHKRGHGLGIKLGIKRSGCSGFSYQLEFLDEACQDYHAFEDKGVKIFVDNQHLLYLSGVELDFVSDGLNEGFAFKNPNSKGGCGCGKSFSV